MHIDQTTSEAHPASYSMDTTESFLKEGEEEIFRGVRLTIHKG
jgi:hypothetical protein